MSMPASGLQQLARARGSVWFESRSVSREETVSLQMTDPHGLDNPNETNLIITLATLEREDLLLITYDVVEKVGPESSGMAVMRFIDKIMKVVLHCRLVDLKDDHLIELIFDAFYKRESVKKKWENYKLPLFAGLLVIYICERMKKEFNRAHEPTIAEEYAELQEEFDKSCTQLLDKCFHEDARKTREALELDYHYIIHKTECRSSHFLELMAIASIGKAQRFLAHPSCQRAIDRRWQPGFRLDAVAFYLYFFFPFMFLIRRGPKRMKSRNLSVLRMSESSSSGSRTNNVTVVDDDIYNTVRSRLRRFYTSPNSKYVVQTIFRGIYILFYAFVLVRMTRKSILVNRFNFWNEVAILVWQITYLIEMAMLVHHYGFHDWSRRYKVDFYRNIIILVNLMLLTLAVFPNQKVRVFALPLADAAFYLSFVFATVRSMRVLNVDSFFGSIVLMIKKMVPIMLKFLVVFLIFWFAYAVCHISLAGHYKSTPNVTDHSLPWLLFINGAFEIFGEADEQDTAGHVQSCPNPFKWEEEITDSSVQCLFKTWMVPLILFTYMLISSIMLVNLITALLTKKYEDISKYSNIYWKSKLYDRLIEHEEKLWVPAPFSLVFYAIKLLLVILMFVPACFGSKADWMSKVTLYCLRKLAHLEGARYGQMNEDTPLTEEERNYNDRAIEFIRKQRDAIVELQSKKHQEEEQLRQTVELILRRLLSEQGASSNDRVNSVPRDRDARQRSSHETIITMIA